MTCFTSYLRYANKTHNNNNIVLTSFILRQGQSAFHILLKVLFVLFPQADLLMHQYTHMYMLIYMSNTDSSLFLSIPPPGRLLYRLEHGQSGWGRGVPPGPRLRPGRADWLHPAGPDTGGRRRGDGQLPRLQQQSPNPGLRPTAGGGTYRQVKLE